MSVRVYRFLCCLSNRFLIRLVSFAWTLKPYIHDWKCTRSASKIQYFVANKKCCETNWKLVATRIWQMPRPNDELPIKEMHSNAKPNRFFARFYYDWIRLIRFSLRSFIHWWTASSCELWRYQSVFIDDNSTTWSIFFVIQYTAAQPFNRRSFDTNGFCA